MTFVPAESGVGTLGGIADLGPENAFAFGPGVLDPPLPQAG